MFRERGYPDTTIADIAEASAVTPGAVTHHFASKSALYEEAMTSLP